MYKNIICFFFFFLLLLKMYGWLESKMSELNTQGWGINLQWTPFSSFCLGQNLPGNITSWMPMQTLVVTPPPACCHHVACLHNLLGISTKNTCILFTLGTRWISCYFCLTRVLLPPMHWKMSKRSSSQYPTRTCLFEAVVQHFNHYITESPLCWVCEVINHTRMWDANFASHSSSSTHRISLYGLEYALGFHSIRPIWPSLIVEILATLTKLFNK